ncbi:hypothetical protein D3C73_648080 [compost metagenome]
MVVDGLAGDRVFLQQRHEDHARLEIVADQATDDTGPGNVLTQLLDALGRAVIDVRHHRPTAEALLGHFSPAYCRGPERLHPGTIHPRGNEQRVVDLLEHLEVMRIVNIAFAIFHHHPHRIAQPTQGLTVVQVVLDERLALREHLLEAGGECQSSDREVTEQDGHGQAGHHHQQPIIEDQPFEQVAGACIEVLEFPDHRHRIEFVISHNVFCLFCCTAVGLFER